jgi:hypothetical protein
MGVLRLHGEFISAEMRALLREADDWDDAVPGWVPCGGRDGSKGMIDLACLYAVPLHLKRRLAILYSSTTEPNFPMV